MVWLGLLVVIVLALGLAYKLGGSRVETNTLKDSTDELIKDAKVRAKHRKRGSDLIESMRKRVRK